MKIIFVISYYKITNLFRLRYQRDFKIQRDDSDQSNQRFKTTLAGLSNLVLAQTGSLELLKGEAAAGPLLQVVLEGGAAHHGVQALQRPRGDGSGLNVKKEKNTIKSNCTTK